MKDRGGAVGANGVVVEEAGESSLASPVDAVRWVSPTQVPLTAAKAVEPIKDTTMKVKAWDTRNLGWRVGADAAAAASAGVLVAPIITIIDRWVVRCDGARANADHSTVASLRMRLGRGA